MHEVNMPFSLLALQMSREGSSTVVVAADDDNENGLFPPPVLEDSSHSNDDLCHRNNRWDNDDENSSIDDDLIGDEDAPANVDEEPAYGTTCPPRLVSFHDNYRLSPKSTSYNNKKHNNIDFVASPLTARSLHALEREYNMDTWRMYNLIHTSRIQQHSNQDQHGIHSNNNNNNGIVTIANTENNISNNNNNNIEIVSSDDDNDNGAIFDLDMEF